jgi:hypothetical protein
MVPGLDKSEYSMRLAGEPWVAPDFSDWGLGNRG